MTYHCLETLYQHSVNVIQIQRWQNWQFDKSPETYTSIDLQPICHFANIATAIH